MGSFATQPMIFVTGASRSGTTVVTRILDGHSDVCGLRETHFFGEFCDPRHDPADKAIDLSRAMTALFVRQNEGILSTSRRSSDPGLAAVLEAVGEQGAAEAFAVAAAAFASRAGKLVPCEQTPRNIYYARELLEWYPQARFVHVLRDPRGVMASQKFRWRRRSLMADPSQMSRTQQLRTWINYHPYTVARLWNAATRLALQLENHPRFFLLRFEDLVRDPPSYVRRVCDFLQIEYEPRMLDIEHLNSSHVSAAHSRRGLDPASVEAWKGRLSRSERAIVHRRCGTLMRRTGYSDEPVAMPGGGGAAAGLRYLLHMGGAAVVNPRRSWIQARALFSREARGGGPQAVLQRRPANGWAANGDTGHGRAGNGRSAIGRVGEATAAAAARASSREGEQRVDVFGLPCMDVALDAAARHLVSSAAAGVRQRVVFVNAHCVNVAVADDSMRRALRGADLIYADGVGMAMAARLQGRQLKHNVNGTDLFPCLCRHAAHAGVPIALLGAEPGVAEVCAAAARREHPGLQVVWCHHGYFDPRDSASVIAELNRSGAGVLLVAMGVPRQERWIMEHADEIEVPVVMGVGGLFDFVSGRVPRAPKAVRQLRLEWLFRLSVEPRRLFGRYVLGNPLFLARALRYALTGRVRSVPHREAAGR